MIMEVLAKFGSVLQADLCRSAERLFSFVAVRNERTHVRSVSRSPQVGRNRIRNARLIGAVQKGSASLVISRPRDRSGPGATQPARPALEWGGHLRRRRGSGGLEGFASERPGRCRNAGTPWRP